MKEFEKWYYELPMREDAEDFTISTYESYKKAWKAALEWISSRISAYPDGSTVIDIEKELRE